VDDLGLCRHDVDLILAREVPDACAARASIYGIDRTDGREICLADAIAEQDACEVAVMLARRPDETIEARNVACMAAAHNTVWL
jgi:hypothetical protein